MDKLATGIPRAPFRPNKIKSLGRGGGGGGEIFNENSRVLCSVGNAFQRGRFQGVNYKLRPLIRQRYGRVYLSFRLGGTNLVARNGWRKRLEQRVSTFLFEDLSDRFERFQGKGRGFSLDFVDFLLLPWNSSFFSTFLTFDFEKIHLPRVYVKFDTFFFFTFGR